MNPRSRESVPNGYPNPISNGYSNGIVNDKHNLSDDEDSTNRKRSCDSHSLSFGVNREKTLINSNSSLSPSKDENLRKDDPEDSPRLTNSELLNNDRIRQSELLNSSSRVKHNDVLNNSRNKQNEVLSNGRIKQDNRDQNHWNNKLISTTQNSPNSQTDQLPVTDSGPPAMDNEFPDYLTYVMLLLEQFFMF